MQPKGGRIDLSDDEIKAAVDYITGELGGRRERTDRARRCSQRDRAQPRRAQNARHNPCRRRVDVCVESTVSESTRGRSPVLVRYPSRRDRTSNDAMSRASAQ